MYCDSCGKKIPDDSVYCPVCGNPTHKFLDTSSLPMLPHYEGIFDGRIGRLRFFSGIGFSIFPMFVVSILWVISNTTTGVISEGLYAVLLVLLIPAVMFSVAMNVGLTIRRVHDLGRSGWYTPLAYIPYLGLLTFIFLMFLRGDPKTNKYGPAPHPHRNPFDDIFNVDFVKADTKVEKYSKSHETVMVLLIILVPLFVVSLGLLTVLALSR